MSAASSAAQSSCTRNNFGAATACHCRHSGIKSVLPYLQQTSRADQAKATAVVQCFESQADEWSEEGAPLYFAWALHQAFLLGIIYARRYRKDDGERRKGQRKKRWPRTA